MRSERSESGRVESHLLNIFENFTRNVTDSFLRIECTFCNRKEGDVFI